MASNIGILFFYPVVLIILPLLDKHPLGVYDKLMNNHNNSHNEKVKELAKKRINIIKGQLDGLLKMIGSDEYCIELLNQSLAIQNSIKSLDALLFEKHLKTHVVDQFQNEKDKAIEELLRLFKRIHQ